MFYILLFKDLQCMMMHLTNVILYISISGPLLGVAVATGSVGSCIIFFLQYHLYILYHSNK